MASHHVKKTAYLATVAVCIMMPQDYLEGAVSKETGSNDPSALLILLAASSQAWNNAHQSKYWKNG